MWSIQFLNAYNIKKTSVMSLMPIDAYFSHRTMYSAHHNLRMSIHPFFIKQLEFSSFYIFPACLGIKPPFDCWENRNQASTQLPINPKAFVVQLVYVSGRILDVLMLVCFMLDESILHLSGTAFGQGLTSADLYIEFIHQNLLRLCDRWTSSVGFDEAFLALSKD